MKKHLAVILGHVALAAAAEPIDEILIQAHPEGRIAVSDTASLIDGLPGAYVQTNGGVSGQPVLHGLVDERVLTLVDGAPAGAACPMHMNPPLSYVDPSAVARIELLPGVTPVSLGGDSIGGAVLVESAPPVFAEAGEGVRTGGRLASFYRSNGAAIGGSVSGSLSTEDFSLRYDGAAIRSGDYRDGSGERVAASQYQTSDQQVTAAWRGDRTLIQLQGSVQYMPYEGFPNADMDLTSNVGIFVKARLERSFDGGELHAVLYYDHIRHGMNGNAQDRYPPAGMTVAMEGPGSLTGMGSMPTRERAQDFGYSLTADLRFTDRDTLRLGSELHGQTFDDVWPGAPAGMMFDYIDIDHATRVRLGTFVDWERRWSADWTTRLGVRNDMVWMNTGPVQGYDGLDSDAAAFNAERRARTDANVDLSALMGYRPSDEQEYSLGLARKNRSPNFFERYAWGTSTIGMVGWFGDGNGYTGTPELKPETAYSASVSADWHDAAQKVWQVKLSPYYSDVENYIGVTARCDQACTGMPTAQLAFANHRARLYGADLGTYASLAEEERYGAFRVSGVFGVVHGQDLTVHTGLYHMMPLNGTVALEHRLGGWNTAISVRAVDRKDAVDTARAEPVTPGYWVADLRTGYLWRNVHLDLAVRNLFDRQYYSPLGGSWQSAFYPENYRGATFRPLPSAGRSVDTEISVEF